MDTMIIHDKLNPEDLKRWRNVCSYYNALQDNPLAFDNHHSAAVHQRYFEVSGELVERYEVPVEENYSISPYTGYIFVSA